ncbi:BafA family autotransporter [Bartonella harrusi]|uniref:BafA family autotransporter n=1 Tax=Bartonella harrusi TaxID=2961895 RepID=A0ABY5EVC3_9HYPH|nr:BafA family autotransporter [Bartonella harrusi]UTO29172.1 BafA family autotransporter [Bartonella harrusi]
MRHKCKLSFSVLMISSCLVQIASANEKANGILTKMTKETKGERVSRVSARLTKPPIFSSNIILEGGDVEIIENGGFSVGATIKKGGMQIVTHGGTAEKTKILGGKQVVFEEKGFDLKSVMKQSSAYEATVSGEKETVGQQDVYDGATVWHTKVMDGGEQNLYTGIRKQGGKAMYTTVSGNGRQHVLMGGEAFNTTLKDSAVQVVYPGGFVDSLTITDSARSWLHVGAKEAVRDVKVNDEGYLYLLAGDRTDHITKQKLSVEGRSDEILFLAGERNNKEGSQIDIENLSGEGGTVIFTSTPYDPRHILLYVKELSGSLHFQFDISAVNNDSDYLFIENGSGNHKVRVTDSGAEITDPLHSSSLVTAISLITDRSKAGGVNFTLVNQFGKEINAIDGGTYMYGLYKKERRVDSSDDATIWYLGRADGRSSSSEASLLHIGRKPKVTTFSHYSSTDMGISTSHRNNNGKRHKLPPKPRPPRHLREQQQSPVLSLGNQAPELVRSANHHPSEEQQQSVVSSGTESISDQILLRPSNPDQFFSSLREELSKSDFLTTPSTDAVLSLSVAPQFVFHNELQTVRAGRGILERSKKSSVLWASAIKSKESVSTGHLDFKLEQTGVVLGLTALSELTNGDFYLGGFGSYDQGRVAHARGGTSSVNTYGIGAYATYFSQSGWYLDGILKYNHYQNTLKAVSTNGLDIEGNYKQWAMGASFEGGYRVKMAQSSWMQPYAQLTWLRAEGKEITLSNKMIGNINPLTSLRSEVGLSLGYEFGSDLDFSSIAYITAAWLRENKNDNHTTINKQHKFTTDLSGNAGKLGIGLSSLVSDKLKLYAEAHYVKGRKVKQLLQGTLGMRYNF